MQAFFLLIKLIDSTDENLQENAVWAIANIAGESSELRDLVIRSGTIVAIQDIC